MKIRKESLWNWSFAVEVKIYDWRAQIEIEKGYKTIQHWRMNNEMIRRIQLLRGELYWKLNPVEYPRGRDPQFILREDKWKIEMALLKTFILSDWVNFFFFSEKTRIEKVFVGSKLRLQAKLMEPGPYARCYSLRLGEKNCKYILWPLLSNSPG